MALKSQCLANLEHDARQTRLAEEADRHEDLRAHKGRRYSSTSHVWG